MVIPWRSDPLPPELLPIMPPMVARLAVEVSGPNTRPDGAAARFSWAWTTPGSTRAVRASGSSSTMRFRWRDRSRTSPGPTVCPARLVPAPRGTSGTPCSAARRRGLDVVGVPGQDHADRGDRVHARVPGVQVPGVVVEADLAVEVAAEPVLQRAGVAVAGAALGSGGALGARPAVEASELLAVMSG